MPYPGEDVGFFLCVVWWAWLCSLPWVLTSLYQPLPPIIWVGLATLTQQNAAQARLCQLQEPALRQGLAVILVLLSDCVGSLVIKVVKPRAEAVWRGEAAWLTPISGLQPAKWNAREVEEQCQNELDQFTGRKDLKKKKEKKKMVVVNYEVLGTLVT